MITHYVLSFRSLEIDVTHKTELHRTRCGFFFLIRNLYRIYALQILTFLLQKYKNLNVEQFGYKIILIQKGLQFKIFIFLRENMKIAPRFKKKTKLCKPLYDKQFVQNILGSLQLLFIYANTICTFLVEVKITVITSNLMLHICSSAMHDVSFTTFT